MTLLADGTYQITTTGPHPSVGFLLSHGVSAASASILAFEYFSANPAFPAHVEFSNTNGQTYTAKATSLSHSEAFTSYTTDLSTSLNWRGNIAALRFGFNASAGKVLRIKNVVLRQPNAEELALASRKAAERADDDQLHARLQAYLDQQYPQEIKSVHVTDSSIRIEGEVSGDNSGLYIAEVPMNEDISTLRSFDDVTPIASQGRSFNMELARFRTLPAGRYDRLLSQWALVRKTVSGFELVSHGRYADEVQSRWNLADEQPRCRKGIGGVTADRPLEDLDQLGVCSITVNIFLNFIHVAPTPNDIEFSWNGRTYYADAKQIAKYDTVLQYAAKRHIIVAAILLVPQAKQFADPQIGKLMAHPDADPSAHFCMPNMDSAEGLETYAAVLNFLAERYSRPDLKYGRIHHWIMHNEVDAGWVWTNAGEKSELTFMDLYVRSMRTMYLIARQYNPHSKVFISLTHYWNWSVDPHFYLPRQMLTDLVKFSKTEGDFEWAIAYHPYPESLFNPRVWEDKKVSFSVEPPLITFKNIEVLNAWAEQRDHFYRDSTRRTIFLSEQGFNSPDYTETSFRDQAAGLAYAWKKIEPLKAIEGMQYHNWVDNRNEGGLRIGLREFPGDPADPYGVKKPIWYLYQKLETPEEDKACAFALPVIGIKDWSQILFKGPIKGLERSH